MRKEKRNMKQRSLMMLLPFALIVTGCSGNLKKGKLFNEKFAKQNFFPDVVANYEYTNPEKVNVSFGDGVTVNKFYPGGCGDVFKVTKDDKEGLFSTVTNAFAIPLDAGVTPTNVSSGSVAQRPQRIKIYAGTKEVDGKTFTLLFDDYGNKLYEGTVGGPLTVTPSLVAKSERESKGYLAQKIVVGNSFVAVAYYNVDRTFKEVITAEEYFKRNPYSSYGVSLEEYGHPELLRNEDPHSGGTRYSIFNTKKGKYVSSYVIPDSALCVRTMGDHVIYQTRNQLPSRAEKYDVSIGEDKFNYETYSVNYLTGKTSKIKTNFLLNIAANKDAEDEVSQKNAKGVIKYTFMSQIQEIGDNKAVSLVKKDVILDEKLKVVADVTGVDYGSLTLFDSKHLVSSKGVIYDFELKETGMFEKEDEDAYNVATVNGKKTIVSATGKYLVEPIYNNIKLLLTHDNEDNHYILSNERFYLLELDNEYKFGKLTKEGEVNVYGTILKSEYTEYVDVDPEKVHNYGNFDKFKVFIKNSDSSKVIFDAATGEIIDVAREAGDSAFQLNTGNPQRELGDSLRVYASVFKRSDGSYYMIRHQQKIDYEYAPAK